MLLIAVLPLIYIHSNLVIPSTSSTYQALPYLVPFYILLSGCIGNTKESLNECSIHFNTALSICCLRPNFLTEPTPNPRHTAHLLKWHLENHRSGINGKWNMGVPWDSGPYKAESWLMSLAAVVGCIRDKAMYLSVFVSLPMRHLWKHILQLAWPNQKKDRIIENVLSNIIIVYMRTDSVIMVHHASWTHGKVYSTRRYHRRATT